MTTRDLVIAAAGGETATPDPYFENVSLLLTGDGTNGAQNNTFLDSSTNNFTITRNGNTTQGTFSPYGNLWSNYFDGNDYLTAPSDAAFAMNTGNFTFECWLNPANWSATYAPIFVVYGTGGLWIGKNSSNFVIRAYGVSDQLTYATFPTINAWTHIVAVRSGTTLSLYYNGTRVATSSSSYNFAQAAASVGSDGDPTAYYTGYISNLRLVKGTAVYDPTQSTITVPTTPLTAVSGTSLLTCQSNRFKDNSSNNFTLTVNGNPSVQRFSPFNPTAAYDAATIGGSGYFDGSGDFLSSNQSAYAFGTGALTVEAWVWPVNTGSYCGIATTRPTISGFADGWYLGYSTSGEAVVYSDGFINNSGVNTLKFNSWNHLAWVRDGTTSVLFVNGVKLSTNTNSQNFTRTAMTIGAIATGAEPVSGYISNLRIVKGSAVYNTAASTITVPTAPLTAVTNTSLLLNFTNAGIPDAAMMNDLETVGNAQVSTSVKKYGTGSLYFDGTGDWLVAPSNPAYNFGTGDFTLECWIYRSTATTSAMLDARGAPAASPWCWYISTTSGTVSFYDGTNYTTSSNVPTGQWVHLAVTRQSGTLKHWINGTLANTPVTVSTALNAGGAMLVGSLYDAGFALNGYIDDLRITKGYARYTANFTPPAQALPTQ
jgi:Concanavalin A-like lectin/glucanases superfamily